MEEVQRIAKATYEKLSQEKKKLVKEVFKSMDQNEDGKITTSEFFHYFENAAASKFYGRSPDWLLKLFQDLDKDKNKSLDFNEFITLFYLLIFGLCCAKCEVILNGKQCFTCARCFSKEFSFDLCRSCYTSENFTHTHENGAAPVFKDRASLLKKSSTKSVIQDVATKAIMNLSIKTATRIAVGALPLGTSGGVAAGVEPDDIIDKAQDIVNDLADDLDDVVDHVDVVVDGILNVLCNLM